MIQTKTVLDYGTPGANNDITALARAQYAAEKKVILPEGSFRLSGRVGSTSDVAGGIVRGQGVNRTTLTLTSGAGFDISGHGATVEDISWIPEGVVTNAITVGQGSTSTDAQGRRVTTATDSNHVTIRNNRVIAPQNNTGALPPDQNGDQGTPDSHYFACWCNFWNVWYSHIENNMILNGSLSRRFNGIGFKFQYSTNIYTSGNVFLGLDTAYWVTGEEYWFPNMPDRSAASYCEGHMLTGNLFAYNRVHFQQQEGLYPSLVNNVIDLVRHTTGRPLYITANAASIIGNWFATMAHPLVNGQPETYYTDEGAPVELYGSDLSVVEGNSWLGNDHAGTALLISDCRNLTITGNTFRSYRRGIRSQGCDTVIVANNQFADQRGEAVDLRTTTRLRYYGNLNSFTTQPALLPAGVRDVTEYLLPRHYAGSVVVTAPGGGTVQSVTVALPAGRFTTKPVVVPVLGGALTFPIMVSHDYDNSAADGSSVRLTFRALEGIQLGQGALLRINFVAVEAI